MRGSRSAKTAWHKTVERAGSRPLPMGWRVCRQCHADLSGVPGRVVGRRHVLDAPDIRLLAHEHPLDAIGCPAGHLLTSGSFPAAVSAPSHQGPNLHALAVSLHQGHVLPTARTGEALAAIGGCPIADGTLLQCRDLAAERLAPTVERIAELIVASRVQHGEEIGTRFLTQSAWHASRSREAMDEIGMGPRFPGRGMHDRLASAETSACAHRIGGAHLVRECAAVARQEHPQGATAMHDACQQWRPLHLTSIPTIERDDWTRARSCELLAAGSAAHLPAPASSTRSRKGRPRQRQATNRLDALLGCADHMLALLDDLRIPLTNSRASRDLRWATVRHTMSGTSRRAAGATALCRIRSSLATMHKPGHSMLSALPAVFHAHSFLVAWESE